MSPKPFLATKTLVIRSGILVPAAKNVNPMIWKRKEHDCLIQIPRKWVHWVTRATKKNYTSAIKNSWNLQLMAKRVHMNWIPCSFVDRSVKVQCQTPYFIPLEINSLTPMRVTKREFLHTISIPYQTDEWQEYREISIRGLLVDPIKSSQN